MIDIVAPAGYVPQVAIAFGSEGSTAINVDSTNPLPVRESYAAAGQPLAGQASADLMAGPFLATARRPVWLSLLGAWSGSVTVMRSTDGGVTKQRLTVGGLPWASFTTNAYEAVAEEVADNASYWLDVKITSGTLTYGVAQ